MTARPGDEKSGADRGRLLASRADREQVVDVLKTAFAAERLTMDEFDLRIGKAYTSRTYAELAAITADIPSEPADVEPRRNPPASKARRAGTPSRAGRAGGADDKASYAREAVKASVCMLAAGSAMAVADVVGGLPMVLLLAAFYFIAMLVAGAQVLVWRHERRCQEPPPPPRRPTVCQRAGRTYHRPGRTDRHQAHPHTADVIRPQLSGLTPAHRRRPCLRRYEIGSPGH